MSTARRVSQAAPSGSRLKRAYELAEPSDGYRVLVDRLWPRGLSKDELALDAWAKELAVSDELRRWLGHDPRRWDEFAARFRRELQSPSARRALEDLAERARRSTVTIVYGAPDEQHNNAVVLRAELEEMLGPPGASRPAAKRSATPRRRAV
jgi:uncharacterized protein YeaO (DUF488 family)